MTNINIELPRRFLEKNFKVGYNIKMTYYKSGHTWGQSDLAPEPRTIQARINWHCFLFVIVAYHTFTHSNSGCPSKPCPIMMVIAGYNMVAARVALQCFKDTWKRHVNKLKSIFYMKGIRKSGRPLNLHKICSSIYVTKRSLYIQKGPISICRN